MANLLDNIIKIQAGNSIKEGTLEYKRITDSAQKAVENFNSSRDLKMNISILLTYQLNGLCVIDWERWAKLPNNQSRTKEINKDAIEYIENIRELNPTITGMIDEVIGVKVKTSSKLDANQLTM